MKKSEFDKTQNVTKLKNTKYDKTKKTKCEEKTLKTQNMTKLKNSNVTKLKYSKCDKTQQLKM